MDIGRERKKNFNIPSFALRISTLTRLKNNANFSAQNKTRRLGYYERKRHASY
uniref:Uncharacterized protein n=1 Tax=Octopus bimaculoides TaxID=37653 RepID=A0A0L8HHU8_OCTBM